MYLIHKGLEQYWWLLRSVQGSVGNTGKWASNKYSSCITLHIKTLSASTNDKVLTLAINHLAISSQARDVLNYDQWIESFWLRIVCRPRAWKYVNNGSKMRSTNWESMWIEASRVSEWWKWNKINRLKERADWGVKGVWTTEVKQDQLTQRACGLRPQSVHWGLANKSFESVSYCSLETLWPLQKTYSQHSYSSLYLCSHSLYIPMSCELSNRMLFNPMDIDSHLKLISVFWWSNIEFI